MTFSSQTIDRFPTTLAGVVRQPPLWPVLLGALGELALARWRLGGRQVRVLVGVTPPPAAPPVDTRISIAPANRFAARVASAIPRMADRVPWRADCLVQASAAQRWLHRKRIPTQLYIVVRKDRPAGFEAHAWLCHGTQIVTGGDILGFASLRARSESS
jgi:hypothetical protein